MSENTIALRGSLRWIQAEFKAHRISGKAYRELREYSSKGNISKPKDRRPKVDSLPEENNEQRQ